jgi:L-iditol 2-dehydrogenase
VRALRLDVGRRGFVVAGTLGRLSDAAFHGWASGLRLAELPDPELPGPDWARLRVVAAGICGTDLSTLAYETSLSLEPFASFPAVLGHEVLARVEDLGQAVRGFERGQRVVVDPIVSCAVRGRAPPCRSCAEGLTAACARSGEAGEIAVRGAPLARGQCVGFHRDLPGGWGERMIAHASQLHPVDPALDDRTAVLLEPLAIALHAVLRAEVRPRARVLVLGSGPIALGAVWALRATGFEGPLAIQVKREREAAIARALGADETVAPGEAARAALLRTGARPFKPLVGPEVFAGGGYDVVLDCVGSRATLRQAIGWAAPGGQVALVGCAGRMRGLDLAFVWAHELRIQGTAGYGPDAWRGERLHAFERAMRLLRDGRAPVREMVTHQFTLAEYRRAFAAASDHAGSGSVKIVLRPDGTAALE